MVKNSTNYNVTDIIALVGLALFATIIVSISHPIFLISVLLFFLLPSIYLAIRTPKAIGLAVLFSAAFTGLLGVAFDHTIVINHQWYVPTIFPVRLFGTVAFEDVIYAFLIGFLIITFYEHFFEKGGHKVSYKHLYYAILIFTIASIFFVCINQFSPSLLHMDYSYLKGGIIFMLIPLSAFLLKFPKYASKFLKTVPYFFLLFLLNEVSSLQLRYWNFPSKSFIGWIAISGVKFPLEEFIFFILLMSVSLLAYFEFFEDKSIKWDTLIPEVKMKKRYRKYAR